MKRSNTSPRTVIGFTLLAIVVAIGISAVLRVIATEIGDDGTPALSLEVGDCLDFPLPPTGPDLARVPVVECSDPHTAEVFHVGQLDPDGDREYPSSDEILFRSVIASCIEPEVGRSSPFEQYVGVPLAESDLDVFPIAPDPGAWEPTGGRFVCLVVPPTDDDELVGSVRAADN